jgi:hypothetical protein
MVGAAPKHVFVTSTTWAAQLNEDEQGVFYVR